jgi:hypothetical protein
MCVIEAAAAASPEIPMLAHPAAAGLVAANSSSGSRMFAQVEAHETAGQGDEEAPTADPDQRQRVHRLEYVS